MNARQQKPVCFYLTPARVRTKAMDGLRFITVLNSGGFSEDEDKM